MAMPFIQTSVLTPEQQVANLLGFGTPSLDPLIQSSQREIETLLGRSLTPNEAATIRQRVLAEKNTPKPFVDIASDVTTQLGPLFQSAEATRQAEALQQQLQSDIASQEEDFQTSQNLLNSFLAAGGSLTDQTLAQLAAVNTPEEAAALAQSALAQQQQDEAAQQAQFETERQGLADFTLAEQQKALEQSRPFILEQLQRAGVPLRSGALADLFADREKDLEAARQGFLAGITREDTLQGRDLGQLFSQQARDLALSRSSGLENNLNALFGTRLGITREDLLGQQGLGQQTGSAFLDTLFNRGVEDRDRREREQQLQLAMQLANEQAAKQKKGSLFGLGGAGIGAALGLGLAPFTGGLSLAAGGLLGAGLGQTIGSGIGGAFGGTSSGGTSPFFNALDYLNLSRSSRSSPSKVNYSRGNLPPKLSLYNPAFLLTS